MRSDGKNGMSYLLEGESPIIKPSGNSKGASSILCLFRLDKSFFRVVREPNFCARTESLIHLKFSVRKPNCSNSETFENRGLTVYLKGSGFPTEQKFLSKTQNTMYVVTSKTAIQMKIVFTNKKDYTQGIARNRLRASVYGALLKDIPSSCLCHESSHFSKRLWLPLLSVRKIKLTFTSKLSENKDQQC